MGKNNLRIDWQILLGIGLFLLSAIVYGIHFLLFHDAHHIFIYLIGDIAFVFIEVLMVTLIIHKLLLFREKQTLLRKMNMVIGTFFNELGIELLAMFVQSDPRADEAGKFLLINQQWDAQKFAQVRHFLKGYHFNVDIKKVDLVGLKHFLMQKKEFLLSLLANPNLLEHESFTDLLWAVFHLSEELHHRRKLGHLSDNDQGHLAKDIQRAYGRLLMEWLTYMHHLQKAYPYLFSLALRTNPFDRDASVEIK